MNADEKLALAMQAIEAADETISLLAAAAASYAAKLGVHESLLASADKCQRKYIKLRKKLEAAK